VIDEVQQCVQIQIEAGIVSVQIRKSDELAGQPGN
jgi:hypothetical protein